MTIIEKAVVGMLWALATFIATKAIILVAATLIAGPASIVESVTGAPNNPADINGAPECGVVIESADTTWLERAHCYRF